MPLSKLFIIFSLLAGTVYAQEIKPLFRLKTSGIVTDFVIDGLRLYAANDQGIIDVFDLTTRKITGQILLPPVKDFQDKPLAAKILSVDRFEGKTLVVATGEHGYRNVWMHDGRHLEQIIGPEHELSVKEARFVDGGRIMLGTLAHEMVLYDTTESYREYYRHVSQSAFADVQLSDDKKTMATSDESGTVTLIDVGTSETLGTFSSENVDNVYKVAYQNGTLITAGQDRRIGVYPKIGKPYHIKSDFLVYCAALSPSGTKGIYSSGTDNDLQVFDIRTRQKLQRLVGHYATVNTIKFINEDELFSAGDEPAIFFWKLDAPSL